MKKYLCFLLVISLSLFTLVSCSNSKDSNTDQNKISIVTTIFPYYDMACAISESDKVNVKMLLPAGSDPHSYEPTPSDIMAVNSCDIFIYTGGESDVWVEDIIDNMNDNAKIIKAIDYVELSNELDTDHNPEDEEDEHIFTSIKRMIKLSGVVNNSLMDFCCNSNTSLNKYVDELEKTDELISNTVNSKKLREIIVADRFPLMYFCNDYGLSWQCAYPGCTSQSEPSVKAVKKLTDYIEENGFKSIVRIAYSNEKTALAISEETNSQVYTLYSGEIISPKDFSDRVSYSDLMIRNAKTLEKVLI